MLFDHQTDSLVLIIQSLNLAQVMQLGTDSIATPLVFITASIPFFTTTLEEYYTNVLYLPCINGAAEGCFMVSLVFIFTGCVGNDWWLLDSGIGYDLTNGKCLLYLFFLGSLLNALFNFATIIKKKCIWVLDALLKILVLVYIYCSAIIFMECLNHTNYTNNL